MRSTLPADAFAEDGQTLAVFGRPGMVVLFAIGALFAAGWLPVALGPGRSEISPGHRSR